MITMRQIIMAGLLFLCLLFAAISDHISARSETLPVESALMLAGRGEILPLTGILDRLRPAIDGEIIDVALVRDKARYLYEIKALGRDGLYRDYHVDARSGAFLGAQ
jgi:uncharacterized membrane protein YkoI